MNTIKFFLLFFIFISFISFAQSNKFWNVIDMSFHQLITKFGVPNDLEYQENCEYWMAYDYGDKKIVYVIDRAIVTSILYVEQVKTYNDAKSNFVTLYRMITSEGFQATIREEKFFVEVRGKIQIQAKLIENFDSFLIAIQVKKI